MARAKSFDRLHNFRFHVRIKGFGTAGGTVLGTDDGAGRVTAGFTSCTSPSVSQDAVDYREGHYIYGRKQLGLPQVAEVTLGRGVIMDDQTMWNWIKDSIEGNADYRADMDILHYSRDSKPASTSASTNTEMLVTDTGVRKIECFECIPMNFKASGDFDASSSEISIQELTIGMEYFNIIKT